MPVASAPLTSTPLSSNPASNQLLGHYAESKTASADACFDLCDEDFKCAGACFTLPDECRLFKFSFRQFNKTVNSTFYIKPRVAADASTSIEQLNITFPIISKHITFSNPFVAQDMLTPAMCFITCIKVVKCGAASFTTDPKSKHNCFLFRTGEFTEIRVAGVDSEFWISYTKPAGLQSPVLIDATTSLPVSTRVPKPTTSPKTTTISTTTASVFKKLILANTVLDGYYGVYNLPTSAECFALCDEESTIAAASFSPPTECRLLRYGFTTNQTVGSTGYIKSEVMAEMSVKSADKSVKYETRLLDEHYRRFDTMTPSQCFARCRESRQCGGATFTTDTQWELNCFLIRESQFVNGRSKEAEAKSWTSFIKGS
jgi:hypothetical protein